MSVKILFLGHSAFKITTEKAVEILIDPYISKNPMCPIKVEEIKKIDLILVTHAAFDHLGDATRIANSTGAKMFCAHDVRIHSLRRGVPEDKIRVVVWGVVIDEAGIKIRAVESRHTSFSELDGMYLSGLPMGFILYTESNIRIYHAGDTSIFSDMKLIGQLYRPNIVILPVGALRGHYPQLSSFEAALATQWIGPEIAIPMHYDAGSRHPELFAKYVKQMAPSVKTVILEPGEVYEYKICRT